MLIPRDTERDRQTDREKETERDREREQRVGEEAMIIATFLMFIM